MKKLNFLKICFLTALLALTVSLNVFAGTADRSFPFSVGINADDVDKLCYAGHITGGGMFYDDGIMVLPEVEFTVDGWNGSSDDTLAGLTAEVELVYEKQDNTGSVHETIKKYEAGDLKSGVSYPLLSETTQKNLKQRKKLYSSDVMSVKLILSYESSGKVQKKKVFLFYVAKLNEYMDKLVSLTAPPD